MFLLAFTGICITHSIYLKNFANSMKRAEATDVVRKFSPEDLRINGLTFHASPEEFVRKFGNPRERHKNLWDDITGCFYEKLEYPELDLWFLAEERTLAFAEIKNTDIEGPRGIKVGDPAKNVLKLFSDPQNEYSKLNDTTEVFYAANIKNDIALPPSCTLETDESGKRQIVLICPTQPYDTEVENFLVDHIYAEHAMATFEIGNEAVETINLWLGALSQ